MAKKKTAVTPARVSIEQKVEKVAGQKAVRMEEPAQVPPSQKAPPPADVPVKAKVETPRSYKNLAVAALIILAIALAYYFFTTSGTTFNPGARTDAETFKNAFEDAGRVFIVMDARGVSDPKVGDNILQCGVDFAGSTGMGGKNVTPLGIDSGSCTAPDGTHELKECFSWLGSGITIYVKGGEPAGAEYFSNGMVVRVGRDYATGTCGIHRS